MKPLTLEMSAFGPFADEIIIDFTKLGDSGLYLVTGDTGAGKTTIFDAISYSLYGDTSGEFRDGKMLRSKYASSDRLTYVQLTFEDKGKIYVIKRIPEQKKAKVRGEGETTQKPEAVLTYPDERQPVTKIAEVDAAVKEIVGLDQKQFSQITMLAQGEFRKMLLSSTDEKQKIFRDIFETDNYEKLQEYLKAQASDMKKEYDNRKEDILRDIVSLECGSDYIREDELKTFQSNRQLVQREEFCDLVADLISCDEVAVNVYVKKLKELENLLQQLNARIGVATERKKSVAELQRIEKELLLLKENVAKQEEQLRKAEENLKDVDALNASAVRIESKLQDYNQYSVLTGMIQDRQQKIQQMERQQQMRNESLLQCVQDEKRLNDVIEKYKDADVKLLECEQELQKVQERKLEIEAMMQDCLKGLQIQQQYETSVKDCQAKTLELEQQSKIHAENERLFYNAQAGILAEKLVTGEACPVCGSIEHPQPAIKVAEVLTKKQLDDEAKKVELVRQQCQSVSEVVIQLKEQLEQQTSYYREKALRIFGMEKVNQEQLRAEQSTLSTRIEELGKSLRQWRNCKVELDNAKKDVPLLAEKYKKLNEELQTVEKNKVAYETEVKGFCEQAMTIKDGLQFDDEEAAKKEVSRLRTQATSLVEMQKREAQMLHQLQQSISAQEGQKQTLEKLLSSQKSEDLDALILQRNQRLQEKEQQEEIKNVIMARLKRNSSLEQRLCKNWCDFDDYEKKYLEVKVLSDTVNGELTGRDKVKLETYIQMAYFERVLAKANVRLLGMTGGQYELVRSEQADNQRSQSGLDINVYDYYTSSERSVKSLSGGESFMASLALALGLADEIQSTVGGIRIDTLFIDEGFGSLDDETLKRAMKELDKLTEGNRLVGVISHVAELKSWIDKQIVVTKVNHQGSDVNMVV